MRRNLLIALCLAVPTFAQAEDAFRWVVQPSFQDAGAAFHGVVPLKQGDLWGLMGADGQWLAAPQFEAIGVPGNSPDFVGAWVPVQKGGKWGVLDQTGAEVVGFDYQMIGKPTPYTPFKFEGKWYALGPDRQFLPEPLPIDTLIGNDAACITGTLNGIFTALAVEGGVSLQTLPEVEESLPPSESYIAIRMGQDWTHISCDDGAILIGTDGPFLETRPMHEGLAAVKGALGWGFSEAAGEGMRFGGDYAAVLDFAMNQNAADDSSYILAPVQLADEKWGYVDTEGQLAIPATYDAAFAFSGGLAAVRMGNKFGFILPDGRPATPVEFDAVQNHDAGLAPVKVGDLWGVVMPAATDPAQRNNLPLAALVQAQTGRVDAFTMQPSNPHYYSAQDIASLHSIFVTQDQSLMITTLAQADAAEVALWDFNTHRLIRKLPIQWATQAVLIPNTQLLAVGKQRGEILIVDAVTGAGLHRIVPNDNDLGRAILDLVVSPDGKWLASTDGEMIMVWDLATGLALDPIAATYQKLRFSDDSSLLYAGNIKGGLIKMTPQGEVLAHIEDSPIPDAEYPPSSSIPNMALSANGVLVNLRQITEQHADGFYYPKLWLELVTEDSARKIDLAAGLRDILSLDITADGRTIAYGAQTNDAYVAKTELLDVATGAVTFSVTQDGSDAAKALGFQRFVYSIDRLHFAPEGGLVSVGSEGQDILLFDPEKRQVTATFAATLANSQSATAMLEGDRFFSSDGGGTVRVWDLAQGALESTVKLSDFGAGPEETIEPDGGKFYLYSGLEDAIVQGFDMEALTALTLTDAEQAALYQKMDYDPTILLADAIQAKVNALQIGDQVKPWERVVVLAKGRIGVVTQPAGLHRAYDLQTGALLAEFVASPDGEWLVVTPEGFFAASANGAQLVSVSTGLHAFSVDQAYQALYRPDLVQAKLAGDPDGTVAKAAVELDLGRVMGSGPAPITKFSGPKQGSTAPEPEIEIEIELQDEGGGIGRIEWRLNGVTVEVQPTRAAQALDVDNPTAKTRIALEPGENLIEVVAYNAADLLASAPRQLVVNWDGVASTEPPALHVLSVGVNDYADGRLQLKYAAADAKAFAAAMEKAGAGLFSSTNIVTLLDDQVTAANLDAAFADMGAKVKSQDVFLFFLAGHGKTIEGKYYFIPQDFRFEGDDPIRDGGIDQDRWQEWAARVKAKKSVMIYDTCESGSITETRSVDAAMAQTAAVQRLTRAIGRTILSASTDDAPALEGYQGHGVMTWAMLDALGQGDTNGNATIEVTELASYLDLKVPEISAAAFGLRQVPQMSIKGSDFALGSAVAVLGDAPESFPATLSHVVAGGTDVLDAPGGIAVQTIEAGVFYGVFKIEEKDGFARIAKDGKALGWVAAGALTPLQ